MNSQEILTILNQHGINYQLYHHPAVFTVQQADQYIQGKDFARCKNLFIKTRNNKKFFLIILPENKRLNTKEAKIKLNCSSLTFASEKELLAKLDVHPGSVSPFNLFNDASKKIPLIVDIAALTENKFVGIHPNDNTKTIVLKWDDLFKLLINQGYLVKKTNFNLQITLNKY